MAAFIAGCAAPNHKNSVGSSPAASSEVVEFHSLSPEEVKLTFLASDYYGAKSANKKTLIAGLVFPDLGKEAEARRNAKLRLASLDADIQSEFERRMEPALRKYAGKTFRAHLRDSGVISASMDGADKTGVRIGMDRLPHPLLANGYRDIEYAGTLYGVGGQQSKLKMLYQNMHYAISLPISEEEMKSKVYAARKQGKDSLRFTAEFDVDFTIYCQWEQHPCRFDVARTNVTSYSIQ